MRKDTATQMSAVIDLGAGVSAGFTRRYDGGVSEPPFDTLNLGMGVEDEREAVVHNRKIAAERFGFDPERVVWMDQVHSADVAVVEEPGTAACVDGIVTARAGLVLAALAADCLPVLAADREAGVIGAAHSGRIGTARGISAALIGEMVRQGAEPGRITVLLGPAICGSCYEVPPPLQEEVARDTPEGACRTRWGTTGVDMRAAVAAQLGRAGVEDVTADRRCTMETPEMFSHRREAPTGRFASFIWRS